MPSGLPTCPCWRLPLAEVCAAGCGTLGYSLNVVARDISPGTVVLPQGIQWLEPQFLGGSTT